MGLGVGSRIWVVGLTCFLRAVRRYGLGAPCVGSGRWVISISNLCSPVRAVGGRAGAIVAPMPCVVSVVSGMPINDSAAMPVAVPRSVAPPATTATAYRCAHCDSHSEGKYAGRGYGCGAVTGGYIGSTVDNSRIIGRNVHHLRVGRLNHNDLRRLLHYGDLRAGFQIARGIGFGTE